MPVIPTSFRHLFFYLKNIFKWQIDFSQTFSCCLSVDLLGIREGWHVWHFVVYFLLVCLFLYFEYCHKIINLTYNECFTVVQHMLQHNNNNEKGKKETNISNNLFNMWYFFIFQKTRRVWSERYRKKSCLNWNTSLMSKEIYCGLAK